VSLCGFERGRRSDIKCKDPIIIDEDNEYNKNDKA
jgi:hypothetical protein